MRRMALLLPVAVSVLLSSVAVASVLASNTHSPNPSAGHLSNHHEARVEVDEAGIHGGSIMRLHQTGDCSLTGVGALPSNWTHGDYVSALATTGDSGLIVEAAHSDCGKPMVSVGHGTDHAMFKTEKHESTPAPGS